MDINVTPELAAAGITALVGAFWVLVKVIRGQDLKHLREVEKKAQSARTEADAVKNDLTATIGDIKVINVKLDNAEASSLRLSEDVKLCFGKLDDTREGIADMRETIAGFGTNYVTRKEFLEENKN